MEEENRVTEGGNLQLGETIGGKGLIIITQFAIHSF